MNWSVSFQKDMFYLVAYERFVSVDLINAY